MGNLRELLKPYEKTLAGINRLTLEWTIQLSEGVDAIENASLADLYDTSLSLTASMLDKIREVESNALLALSQKDYSQDIRNLENKSLIFQPQKDYSQDIKDLENKLLAGVYNDLQNVRIDSSAKLHNLTLTGNLTMPDGGTIGNGPLLTFDDTSDRLILTGGALRILDSRTLAINSEIVTYTVQGTSWSSRLFVEGLDAGVQSNAALNRQSNTAARSSWFDFLRAGAAFGAVADGYAIGDIGFRAHDGTDYNDAARIKAIIKGAVSANTVPTDIVIYTTLTNSLVEVMRLSGNRRVSIGGVAAPLAGLDINQSSTTGAISPLKLTQADVSEEFIKLVGTSAADNSQSLVDAADLSTPGAITGWIRVYIQDDAGAGAIPDGIYFIPFYSTPTA